MEPASKHTRMVTVRGAGTLLGVLMLVAVAAASDSPIAGALFENPHWPPLDTMGTFLSIVNVAGLGVLVVFAVGCYLEPIGRVILDGADQWIANGRYRAAVVLSALIVLYVLVYCGLTFYRHYNFNSTGWDLAIQDQVVWNTSQGRLFESSIEVRNYLGDHVQPYLAILGLVYVLIASPYVLLAAQTMLVRKVGPNVTGRAIALAAKDAQSLSLSF